MSGRHQCAGDPCAYCDRAIDAAESDRDYPINEDSLADFAAADMVFGREFP